MIKPVPTSGLFKVTSSIVITMNLEFNSMCRRKEIHWCSKFYLHWSGRHARETSRWLLECPFEQKLVSFVERFHEVHSIERKNLPRSICGPAEDWQKFKRLPGKLERLMAAAMPCKKCPKGISKVCAKSETASEKTPKTIAGCLVESHVSTGQRAESSLPAKHEDHIAGKGFTSMTHYNLFHKFIPMPQGMEKARDNPSMATGESPEQEGCYSRSTKRQQESPLCPNSRSLKTEPCSVVTL